MIIFKFIYYVFLKPIGRVFFGMPEYEPENKSRKTKSSNYQRYNNFEKREENYSLLKGHAFEEFIATKVSKNRGYKLKEWRGDKYANGIYAESNLYPDLEFEYTTGINEYRFAIECKWRSNYYEGRLELFKESQLKNYWRYSAERRIKVFVAIGVGTENNQPRELYVIPLSKIHNIFIYKSELSNYRIEVSDSIMYDPLHQELLPQK